jgi:hypothetical protein
MMTLSFTKGCGVWAWDGSSERVSALTARRGLITLYLFNGDD